MTGQIVRELCVHRAAGEQVQVRGVQIMLKAGLRDLTASGRPANLRIPFDDFDLPARPGKVERRRQALVPCSDDDCVDSPHRSPLPPRVDEFACGVLAGRFDGPWGLFEFMHPP